MEEKRAGKFVGMRDLGREETKTSYEIIKRCYNCMCSYCGGLNLERNSYICTELYHCVFVKELWWVNYEIGMEIGLKIVVFVYSWL